MAHIHGKQDKIVTRGLVYAVDGIDHGTFPGKGSSSTTYGDLVGQASATLQNDTTYRYHKNGILTLDKDNADYYSVALDLSSTSTVSVGMWARFREYPTSSTGILMEFSDNYNNSPYEGFQVFASSGNSYKFSLEVRGNAGYNQSDFNKSLVNDGRWHYLVFVFDKTQSTNECSLFVDGTQATATANPDTNNNTNSFGDETLHIGGRKPSSGTDAQLPWTVDLGPLHVYKVGLSAAEVTQNFNLWKSRFQPSGTEVSTSGSIVHLDPDNSTSYGGSGATFTDLSGNDNDGTISGATYVTSTSASAFTFDGSNDTLELPNWDTLATDEITMNIWFKTTGTSQYYLFGGRRDGATNSSHLSVGINLDVGVSYTGYINGIVRNAANSTSNFTRYQSNSGITDGEWHCLHYAVKNNSQVLYVDAVQLATSAHSYAASVANSLPYHIASFDGTDKYFDGEVGQVQLVSRFLTAAEVKADYNALVPRYLRGFDVGTTDYSKNVEQSGLAVNFDFGSPITYPGSGTSVTDVKGGYTGTLSGATYKKDNGGYIDFDGSNDYISTTWTQPAQDTSSTFSWMVWVYADNNANPPLIGDRGSSLGFTKLTTNNFEYYDAGSPLVFGGSISTGAWKNICVVKNGTNFIYYTNGAQTATGSSSVTKSTRSFFIGGDNGAGEYFNGRIGQVCVYTTALTAAQVLSNYTATKSRFGL